MLFSGPPDCLRLTPHGLHPGQVRSRADLGTSGGQAAFHQMAEFRVSVEGQAAQHVPEDQENVASTAGKLQTIYSQLHGSCETN